MNNFTKTIISGLKAYIQKSRGNWNQNDETALDYIKNRTHYSEMTEIITNTLEWDGNTEGLLAAVESEGLGIYKVSDTILEPSDFVNGIIAATVIQDGIEESAEMVISEDAIGIFSENLFVISELLIMVVKEDNTELEGVILPEAGIYFLGATMDGRTMFVNKLEINNGSLPFKTVTEVVHKIDKKYLPELSSIKNILDGNTKGSVRTIGAYGEVGEYAFAEGHKT